MEGSKLTLKQLDAILFILHVLVPFLDLGDLSERTQPVLSGGGGVAPSWATEWTAPRKHGVGEMTSISWRDW